MEMSLDTVGERMEKRRTGAGGDSEVDDLALLELGLISGDAGEGTNTAEQAPGSSYRGLYVQILQNRPQIRYDFGPKSANSYRDVTFPRRDARDLRQKCDIFRAPRRHQALLY